MSGLKVLGEWVHEVNEAAGWNDERAFGEDVALIHSEASEALEAFRDSGDPTARWYSYTLPDVGVDGVTLKNLTAAQVESITDQSPEDLNLTPKPEGCGSELADVIIRVMHTAKMHGIDVAAEVIEKVQHNSTRGFRHGGKHL